LQIEQNARVTLKFGRQRAHHLDPAGVILLRAVGRVQTKNIDSRLEQIP
jgi:hypothetical protein